jgi:hypothetical protein
MRARWLKFNPKLFVPAYQRDHQFKKAPPSCQASVSEGGFFLMEVFLMRLNN